jgi:hypothetical protein
VNYERAGYDFDFAIRRAHDAPACVAKVDLGRMRMAVVGAYLAGLPARNCRIPTGETAEYLLDVLFAVEALLLIQVK